MKHILGSGNTCTIRYHDQLKTNVSLEDLAEDYYQTKVAIIVVQTILSLSVLAQKGAMIAYFVLMRKKENGV